MGAFARGALTSIEYRGEEDWDLPAYGLGGLLDNYWSTRSAIEDWDRDLFISQANTMTELAGVLMSADLRDLITESTPTSRPE